MRSAFLLIPAILAVLIGTASAQDAPRRQPEKTTFAGQVVELTTDKLTVVRSILGGHAEKRTFLLKNDTKVEGKLRLKAKVTVGYAATDEGDVARLIVVRTTRR